MNQTHSITPSRRSLLGLGLLNFFAADVQGGLGPYLTVYLTVHGWDGRRIGHALAVCAACLALAQLPSGFAMDRVRYKRALVALAATSTAVGCLVIAADAQYWPVLAAQAVLGAASALLPCGMGAITLGLVGAAAMADRTARNASINHAGSLTTAILTGLCGQYLGLGWIFVLVCLFVLGCNVALSVIAPGEIDHARARGSAGDEHPVSLRDLLRRRDLWAFLVAVALFFAGNAAMLPIAGRALTLGYRGGELLALGACVVAAQAVMVAVAFGAGRALHAGFGRRSLWVVGFAMLPLRGVLFAWAMHGGLSVRGVIAIQLLDGVATGIFSVASVVIAADLTRGTGRFNVAVALVALAMAAGTILSNLVGGEVLQRAGFSTTFLTLGAIAAFGLLFSIVALPETCPRSGAASGRLRSA